MEDQEVINILEQILQDSLYFDAERFKAIKINSKTRLREDLKFEFLDCYQISCLLEKNKGISIIEELDDFITIGDYIACIKPKLEEREKIAQESNEYYI